MRGIVIFGGSSHPQLADQICARLGIQPGKATLSKFSNNETSVQIQESVRDMDVYIIQSGCGHVNNNFMELLVMLQACKTASAKKVTAVIPFFPYSRQPDAPHKRSGAPLTRAPPMTGTVTPSGLGGGNPFSNFNSAVHSPSQSGASTPVPQAVSEATSVDELAAQIQKLYRTSQSGLVTPSVAGNGGFGTGINAGGYKQWVARSGTLVAELLTCAGADQIITMDLHDPQFQGFFDCPVDNLFSMPLMVKYIKENIANYEDAVIVSPDAGGAKRATAIADKLSMDFALIHKERRHTAQPYKQDLMLVGDVRGKVCILIDDIADTSFTITKAAKVLHENGATRILAIITHAILSGDADERIEKSRINEIVVSNSIPQDDHLRRCSKIRVFNIAPIFAEAIRRIHHGESVSMLFDASQIIF
ncbi:phosphoribosyltransferase-like protein [Jimgerdemannia flammicorona]|uniref:Phosphoribosyltransferase-like protein n=2 Tax=Jimgerdemannia flammicorona TaxID=994334 RepID=A0A433B082_9FUNG|nr:phosphoribosyltransferase-like protein [Jimgerdemannia flammicorona]RUS35578.1 phosphoribosyltransferase-like protein [Jimgerdemannia flammicorona]